MLFGSKSSSSSQTQTQADSDNLAADNNAQVTKINQSDGSSLVLLDPGSVENVGHTIDLVGSIAHGLFEVEEVRAKNALELAQKNAGQTQAFAQQSHALAQQAISASRNDTAETLDKLIVYGIPALAAVFIFKGLILK